MIRTKKKGFTIVELVIVIAVVAVLAGVLIPTFANLFREANMSVDEQFVRQMNTIIAAEYADGSEPASVDEVKEVLAQNGVNTFDATHNKNTFYWIRDENRIVIWTGDAESGANGKVTFPEDLAEKYASVTNPSGTWYILNELPVVEIEGESPSELASALKNAIKDKDANNIVIELPVNANVEDCLYFLGTAMQGSSGNGKNVTIDLNGGTITNTKYSNQGYFPMTVPVGGSLTLENGKLNYPTTSEFTASLAANSGSSLILRDMDITSDGAAIYPTGSASEIIIENSTIKTTGAYGVGTNRAEGSNIKIVIRNSTIEGGSAVFLNTSGEVIIENSTIIGTTHGVAIRAGKATISNTTIKVTDTTPGIYSYKNFNEGAAGGDWFGGNALPAAGIVIGCYFKNNTYSGDAVVNLTNVKIDTPDASVLPTVVMAARMNGKVASLTYDSASSVGEVKVYGDDWIGKETTFTHNGTITVNGEKKN